MASRELASSVPAIRRATLDDLAQIIALLHDDVLGESRERLIDPLPIEYYQAFEAIAADPNHNIFVCILEERIVGCMQLSFLPGLSHVGAWRAQLESVRVAKLARRQGIGERMIGFAVEEAQSRNCGFMQLTTHKARVGARHFYEALGFQATHEGMKRDLR